MTRDRLAGHPLNVLFEAVLLSYEQSKRRRESREDLEERLERNRIEADQPAPQSAGCST